MGKVAPPIDVQDINANGSTEDVFAHAVAALDMGQRYQDRINKLAEKPDLLSETCQNIVRVYEERNRIIECEIGLKVSFHHEYP